MNRKPTYLRAAIMDWKEERISLDRLFEILRVPFGDAYMRLRNEERARGTWRDMPAERIEELLLPCIGVNNTAIAVNLTEETGD